MSIISDIKKYIIDVKTETRKISWPTRHKAMKDSTLVIIISLATAVFLGGVDYLLTQMIETYIIR